MDPRFLVLWPLRQLEEEKTWLFPKLRVVEVHLLFFRVWLRREFKRSKYKGADASAPSDTPRVQTMEELYRSLQADRAAGVD